MNRILLISRDRSIFKELSRQLISCDFNVDEVSIDIFDHHVYQISTYDFILLNLEFADKVNDDILKFIKMDSKCPIFVFSKNFDEQNQIHYVELGAQRYIEIPFSEKVLVSQILSVMKYINSSQKNIYEIYRFGPVSIDLENRKITNQHEKLSMTTVEYKLLNVLIAYRDQIVSKEKLIHRIWDHNNSATDNALGIHIARLRKKLDCCDAFQLIETIWGLGYRFNYSLCEKMNQ